MGSSRFPSLADDGFDLGPGDIGIVVAMMQARP
jgi:hypothetical protein